MQIYCCSCKEAIPRKQLELKYNPYYFRKKAYCKKCGNGAIIILKGGVMTKAEAIQLEVNVQNTIAKSLNEDQENVFVSLALSNLFKVQIINDGEYLFDKKTLKLVCYRNYNHYTYLTTLEDMKIQLESIVSKNKQDISTLIWSYENRRELVE